MPPPRWRRATAARRWASIAAATLGRVWLVALAILLVGLAEREAGLAAGGARRRRWSRVYFAGQGSARMLDAAREHGSMSTRAKVLLGLGVYFAVVILLLLIFGNAGKNDEFKPQNEFKLEPWITIKIGGIDLSINRAVLYLVLASALTIGGDGLDRHAACSRSRTGSRPRSRSPTT